MHLRILQLKYCDAASIFFLETFRQLINVFYLITGVVCIASVPYPSCAYQSLKDSMDIDGTHYIGLR